MERAFGKCPVCKQIVRLLWSGALSTHSLTTTDGSLERHGECLGSGCSPKRMPAKEGEE